MPDFCAILQNNSNQAIPAMSTETAIQTLGATALYYAAIRATEGDTQALQSVGIE